MQDIIFWLINGGSTIFVIWGILWMMSWSGKVDNFGRLFILLSFVPVLSIILAMALAFVFALFCGGTWFDKWWQSPKMVTWRTLRKIRKRRRGPLVRIVEHMHKKQKLKEKANEADVSED